MFKKSLFIIGTTIVFTVIGLISFPYTEIAYGEQGCLFQGSWYGINGVTEELEWTINVHGQSHSSGINNLEDPYFDPTLQLVYGDEFEDAVRLTTLRGTWERSGSNTFRWTMIGQAVDDDGNNVWIGKLSGTSTLMDNCNTEFIEGTLEVFGPDQDPFMDFPQYGGFPVPNHYGYRMRVDPPYSN